MNREKRMLALLKLLVNRNESLNSEAISQKLKISERTLRDDLASYRDFLQENGIVIIAKKGSGYILEITNEKSYYNYIQRLLREEQEAQYLIPVYPEERENYLMKLFLTAEPEEYLKLDDIAEKLFISRSTVTNDLKVVRQKLGYFHLTLETKPAYGLILRGSEFHRRSCIAKYFFHTETSDSRYMNSSLENQQQQQIRDILYGVICEEKFKLSDIGFHNLVIHLFIALSRLTIAATDTDELLDKTEYLELTGKAEYHLAELICGRLEEAFQLSFPVREKYYITIHLLGKKAMQYTSNFVVSEETKTLLQLIFAEIDQVYQLNFSQDFDLFTQLALHFQPMLNRLKYGLMVENPLLQNQAGKFSCL